MYLRMFIIMKINEDVDMSILEKLDKNPTVMYHDGGLLFAGDLTSYSAGWYLFLPGIGAFDVDVHLEKTPIEA